MVEMNCAVSTYSKVLGQVDGALERSSLSQIAYQYLRHLYSEPKQSMAAIPSDDLAIIRVPDKSLNCPLLPAMVSNY